MNSPDIGQTYTACEAPFLEPLEKETCIGIDLGRTMPSTIFKTFQKAERWGNIANLKLLPVARRVTPFVRESRGSNRGRSVMTNEPIDCPAKKACCHWKIASVEHLSPILRDLRSQRRKGRQRTHLRILWSIMGVCVVSSCLFKQAGRKSHTRSTALTLLQGHIENR